MMKNLIVETLDGRYSATYDMETVRCISNDIYKHAYTPSEITSNGLNPNDSCITIYFEDGTTSTFGHEWLIAFE